MFFSLLERAANYSKFIRQNEERFWGVQNFMRLVEMLVALAISLMLRTDPPGPGYDRKR